MVLDYRRVAAAARTPRRKGTADDEPLNVHGAVLAMQASAGNRATRAALAQVTAQRAVRGGRTAPRSHGAGGQLTLDGNAPFTIVSASWSQTAKVHTDQTGHERTGTLVAAGLETPEIEVTVSGKDGDRMFDLAQRTVDSAETFKQGSLRLDRKAAGGSVAASSIDLADVVIVSVQRSGDDPSVVIVRLGVGGLAATGQGKEASDSAAAGTAVVTGGGAEWTPLPVLQWVREPSREETVGPPGGGSFAIKRIGGGVQPVKVRAEVAAGPNLARLSAAMSKGSRLEIVYTPKAGPVMELHGAIIDRMAGSSKGPGEVEIGLTAEQARTR